MDTKSVPRLRRSFTVELTSEEFEQIASCSSALHAVRLKTPHLDANEKLDIVATAGVSLSRTVAVVNERLSDILHGSSDEQGDKKAEDKADEAKG